MRLSLLAALSLFPVALFGESATAQEQEATDEASGFSLPCFRPADPAKSFEFEGEEAQRLAQEIFAVGASQVTKASVQVRKAAQWGGGYFGLFVDLALDVRTARNAICEEPHVLIWLDYDGHHRIGLPTEMRLRFEGGRVESHTFAGVETYGRYKSVSEPPESKEALLEECRKLAKDKANWTRADGDNEFALEERMNRELSEALQTLPMASIRCTTIEGTSCNFARDELEALVSKSRPDDSEHIFVPEEGPLYILRYADPNARDDTYYEILMYPAFRERPTMIEIRQKQFIRPVL